MEKNITVRLTAGKNNEISAYVKTEIKKNVLIIKHKHIKLEVTGNFDIEATENIIKTELKKEPRTKDYINILEILENLICAISKTQDIKQIIIETGKYINFIYCIKTFQDIFRKQDKQIDIEVDYNHPISHKWFVLRGKHKIYMEHNLFIVRGAAVSSYTPLKEIYCDRINEVRDNFDEVLEAIQ